MRTSQLYGRASTECKLADASACADIVTCLDSRRPCEERAGRTDQSGPRPQAHFCVKQGRLYGSLPASIDGCEAKPGGTLLTASAA